MKNHNGGPLGLFFFKFQNFGKNPENRAGSGPGFPISGPGLHRDPEIAKMAIFGIKIVGISRFRDPDFGIPSTLKLSRKIEGILNMLRKIVYEEKIFLLKKNESTEFFYKLRINFN